MQFAASKGWRGVAMIVAAGAALGVTSVAAQKRSLVYTAIETDQIKAYRRRVQQGSIRISSSNGYATRPGSSRPS